MDGTIEWKKTLLRCVLSSEVLHNECLCCLYQRIYISIIILKGLTSSLNICVEIEKGGMEHIKECNNLENQKSYCWKNELVSWSTKWGGIKGVLHFASKPKL